MFKGFVFGAIVVQLFAGFALAKDKTAYDAEVMPNIHKRLAKVSTVPMSELPANLAAKKVGEPFYLPLEFILRGRSRVAAKKIKEKIEKSLEAGELKLNDDGSAKLKFDDHQSSESLENPIKLAKTRDGFVLLSKPEKCYQPILLGSKTLPVVIVRDLSQKSQIEAWRELKTDGSVYLPESEDDLVKNPPTLATIKKKEEVPTPDEIISRIERQLRDVRFTSQLPPEYRKPTIDDEFYLPLEYMMRGQGRISADNIYRKAKDSFKEGGFKVDSDSYEVKELAWDEGRSSRNLKKKPVKILVVKTVEGYIIIDGHHEAYSAVLVGSKTVPVHVVDDFTKSNKARGKRDWTMAQVWAELQRTQRTLFLDEDPEWLARPENRPTLRGMTDSPNRFLARLLAAKVITEEKGQRGLIEIALAVTRGIDSPLWLKVDVGVAMIEFHIADVLTEAGITYRSEWGENNVPAEIIDKSRRALIKARADAVEKARNTPANKLPARDQILLKIPPIFETAEQAKHMLDEKNREDLLKWIDGYVPPRQKTNLTCEMLLAI